MSHEWYSIVLRKQSRKAICIYNIVSGFYIFNLKVRSFSKWGRIAMKSRANISLRNGRTPWAQIRGQEQCRRTKKPIREPDGFMPRTGFEPARVASLPPQSSASASSATWARVPFRYGGIIGSVRAVSRGSRLKISATGGGGRPAGAGRPRAP